MFTRFRNRQVCILMVILLTALLMATPVLARSDLATDENRAPNPPQNPDGSFPDGDSSEIPTAIGIPIYVPASPELGYNPAEEEPPVVQVVPGKVGVLVNGTLMQFPDQEPYIDQAGRTMVPVRFVTEALGAKVDFKNGTVIIDKDSTHHIEMKIGENKAIVNSEVKTFDTKSVLTAKQRTMVPLRFLSETLGAKVGWNQETWTATVVL